MTLLVSNTYPATIIATYTADLLLFCYIPDFHCTIKWCVMYTHDLITDIMHILHHVLGAEISS